MIGKKDKPMNVAFANQNLDDLFENLKNGDTKAKQSSSITSLKEQLMI